MPPPLGLSEQNFGSLQSAASANCDQLAALDNVLRLSPQALKYAPVTKITGPQPNLAAAFDLLGRASEAMDTLQKRYDDLAMSAKTQADQLRFAAEAAHETIRELERANAALKSELAKCDAQATRANLRAETAEDRAKMAEQRALQASQWLERYHDRIVETFGSLLKTDQFRQAG